MKHKILLHETGSSMRFLFTVFLITVKLMIIGKTFFKLLNARTKKCELADILNKYCFKFYASISWKGKKSSQFNYRQISFHTFFSFFSNFLFIIVFLSPSCFSNLLSVYLRCISVKTKMIICKVGSWITVFTYFEIKIILIRELVQF